MVQEMAEKTAQEDLGVGISAIKPVSKWTIGRLKETFNIKDAVAETTTDARAMAVSDIRSALSFTVMKKLMTDSSTATHSQYGWNAVDRWKCWENKDDVEIVYIPSDNCNKKLLKRFYLVRVEMESHAFSSSTTS